MHKTTTNARRAALALPTLIATLLTACGGDSSLDLSFDTTITGVLEGNTMSTDPIPCVGEAGSVRVCQGDMDNGTDGADLRFETFDGVPLAVCTGDSPSSLAMPKSSSFGAVSPLALQVRKMF